MKDKGKIKDRPAEDRPVEDSRCYSVVDSCGCVVGTYCCDGQDMSSCKFQSC